MKKVILVLAGILAFLMVASCDRVAPNKPDTTARETENDSTADADTSETTDPAADTAGVAIGSEGGINRIFSHDAVECRFYSVKDLETYLMTGSTQADDYSQAPAFETFPQINDYKTNEFARQGYVSLLDVYGMDVDRMDSFDSVTFKISTDCIVYTYYFEKVCITATYSPGCFGKMSTSAYYAAYCTYLSQSYAPQNYAGTTDITNGYVLRESNELEVVYTYRNGIPRKAGMLVGNYFVSVTSAASSDVDEASREFSAILSSEEFAPVSSIFAKDAAAFDVAVQKAKGFL